MASQPKPDELTDATPVPRSEVVSPANVMTALLDGLEQLSDGAFLVESGGVGLDAHRVVYANPAFAAVLDQPACDLLEQPLRALFPTVTAALAPGAASAMRIQVELARGTEGRVELELSLHPVRGAGGDVRHWLGFVRDVSGARERSERQGLAAVELLAAGMAHEVNNPLASVTTNLEWLVAQLPSLVPATPNAAQRAELQSAISAALVDALVGAERIEATIRYLSMLSGMEDARRDLVDVRVLLDAAVTELEAQIGDDIRVVREYAEIPPVMASEQRLKQAFVNLVLNAAQAIGSQSGERSITLRVSSGGRVRVEVEDTGGGVAESVEPRLFSPFVTTKPPGLGKGLGLFLCRRILEAAGGNVGFSSRPGQGATFWVELPAAVG